MAKEARLMDLLDLDTEFAGECLAGRLLIAMPGIDDPHFERAVILMCTHGADHAMGVRLNHPMGTLNLGNLMERLKIEGADNAPDVAVLNGGPVEQERGFVLHTDDYQSLENTLPIAGGVSLTATREVLEAIGDPSRAPELCAFALGCAQWGPGQLEEELVENVWLTADADLELIFDAEYDTKWSRALAKLGVAADRLSAQAGRA
jgi:putative transcriptional regulator